MIKTSLFADHEREAKLNQLGDALQVMEQHVDFAPVRRSSTLRRRAPAASVAAVRLSPPTCGAGAFDPAAIQLER